MSRLLSRLLLILLLSGSAGCALLQEEPPTNTPRPITPTPTAASSHTPQSGRPTGTMTAEATVTPPASSTPTASSTEQPLNTPTRLPISNDLSLVKKNIFVYPVPAVYAGDRITFQVLPFVPEGLAPDLVHVQILINDQLVINDRLNWRTLGGHASGLYQWVWDTQNRAGDHTITVVLDPADTIQIGDENPDNNRVDFTLTIHPVADLPSSESQAAWLTAENNCCILHVVSNTAAHRDLQALLAIVDSAFVRASVRLAELPQQKFNVYLVDRVIGQGGYASGSMVISYLDRDYSGGGLEQVLTHEAVHLLDHQFAPNRIAFLAEGVAVWATGGHYYPEDLSQRTKALIELGQYIPLVDLINNFYPTQHEIGYLEAGSFVEFLVNQYGWPKVRPFYSDVNVSDAPTLSEAIDFNLQLHFNKSLDQLEAEWLDYLDNLPRSRQTVDSLRTSIRYYQVMRRYQSLYDSTAYYLTAWLPPPEQMENQATTAELTRHPESTTNLTLETLFIAANTAMLNNDYELADTLITNIVRILDNNGSFLDPLTNNYLAIVQMVTNLGYETQRIELSGDQALVWATRPQDPFLQQLQLRLSGQSWVLAR